MKDLSLHILDIAQNSISAKATLIEIIIEENIADNQYILQIKDNGSGMPKEFLEKVTDPYATTRTTRKVGLGLPLLKLNTERTGGSFKIESELGKGTIVTAISVFDNIDRLPLGDIAGVVVMLCSMNPEIDFVYTHKTSKDEYVFDSREVKEALDGMPINEISIQKYLKELINENLKEIS
jgi:hypothetical protein